MDTRLGPQAAAEMGRLNLPRTGAEGPLEGRDRIGGEKLNRRPEDKGAMSRLGAGRRTRWLVTFGAGTLGSKAGRLKSKEG